MAILFIHLAVLLHQLAASPHVHLVVVVTIDVLPFGNHCDNDSDSGVSDRYAQSARCTRKQPNRSNETRIQMFL
jgi:hypothetical protein